MLDTVALVHIRAILAEGGAVVVVERTADRFREYLAVWRSLFDTSPITSRDIHNRLVKAGFSIRSIELRDEAWPFESMRSIYRHGGKEYLASLPRDMRAALSMPGEVGVIGSLACLIAEARDDSRHLIPAVATAMVRKRLAGQCSLLIQRRHREPEFWDHWELPQGHLRHDETFFDAACRELLEETSITGFPCSRQPFLRAVESAQATVQEGFCLTTAGSYPKQFFSVPILMEYRSGNARSFSNREFKWASISELTELISQGGIYPLNESAVSRFIGDLGWYDD
jgi:8-oxo-dGTP pyrophosphatase MutT (NUDIX family)